VRKVSWRTTSDRLKGKIALVTGGSSGLGKATAERIHREGGAVIISDIDAHRGEEVAQAIGAAFLVHDVADEGAWTRVLSEIQQSHGGLHILVNNAGVIGPTREAALDEATLESWRRVFEVNVHGVFLGCRAAVPIMCTAGGGCIVNVASIAGLLPSAHAVAYGASKAAVTQFTKSVAQHCIQRGWPIRCNSVHPGDAITPLWEKHARGAAAKRGVSIELIYEEARALMPFRRFIGVEDVAAAIAYLASDDAVMVTGTELVVDGGFMGYGRRASSSTVCE